MGAERTVTTTVWLVCAVFAFALTANAEAKEKRWVAARQNLMPVYPSPSDSLPPTQMARKGRIFPVAFSTADDSGRIWFCVYTDESRRDTGWVPASLVKYTVISVDSSSIPAKQPPEDRQDRKRRYRVLRKHPEWPHRIRKAVREGEILLHMTESQMVASWGEPVRSCKAFLVGVGDYRVDYFQKKGREPAVGVAIQDGRVIGWTED